MPEWSIWQHRQDTPIIIMTTTTHLKVPVLHPDELYDLYKQSKKFWVELIDIPKKERAGYSVLNIPADHPLGFKQKVLGSEVGITKLNCEDGVKNLLECLSEVYAKDKFVELYDKYKEIQSLTETKRYL